MNKNIIFCIGVLLVACEDKKQPQSLQASTSEAQTNVKEHTVENAQEAEAAKKWLIKSILGFFQNDARIEDMQRMTTSDYYAYKTDATNVDLGLADSLTENEFHKKWQNKFDTSKAGIGQGFLISGQDWSKIEVEKCQLLSSSAQGFLFDVVLKDEGFQAKYPSQILVKYENGRYLIADVR